MSNKQPSPKLHYDVATALTKGRRDYQEDALATDFPHGGELGFAVLSDGMGGHAAGDVASKIVVTEVFSELKFQSGDVDTLKSGMVEILKDAAMAANDCMRAHTRSHPDTTGMGATLVAPVILRDRLYWISVGDSPLFLMRDGTLERLNEDHSLAPQIDLMVDAGLITAEIGANHPDRNCLTSVLIGGGIEKIDCPDVPLAMQVGDIVLAASDGLQTLSDDDIADVIASCEGRSSAEISEALMDRLAECDEPTQDNASICIIQVREVKELSNTRTKGKGGRRRTAEIVPMPIAQDRKRARPKNADVAEK